ncbi:unnamed protein product, partial [marine sediment metagenome]
MEIDKIKEWMQIVNIGLVNGLSHTNRDGRTDDIDFWRKRSQLFNGLTLCIKDLVTEQNYEYSEKDLRKIANDGYQKEEYRTCKYLHGDWCHISTDGTQEKCPFYGVEEECEFFEEET